MRNRIISFVVVICITAMMTGTLMNSLLKKETYIYSIEANADDIMIKDLILISSNDTLYIPSGYEIEKVGNKKISDIKMVLLHNKDEVMDWSFQFDQQNVIENLNDIFLDNISVKSTDKIIIQLSYKVDEVNRDFYETVDLSSNIKYKN